VASERACAVDSSLCSLIEIAKGSYMRVIKFTFIALVISLGMVLVAPSSWAQISTGSLSGTVLDQSGAAVPGASVYAVDPATGASESTTTNATGFFKFGLLQVGAYNLTIEKEGFQKKKVDNAQVQVNSDNDLGGIALEVGSTTSTVEVTAAPPMIEATTSQVTNTFTEQEVTTFAGVQELEGLDYLALQVPGVAPSRDLQFSNTNGVGFSVNGLRGENNDQQVDGQNNNDNSIGGPALFFENADWASEYQIVTNNFGSEYGRNSGSVVNEITKSGTNVWHGTVADEENNSILNTLTNQQKFFDGLTKVPHSNFNSPSSTIGGPLWKDHVFVFGGFDAQISPQVTEYSTGSLTPTPTGVGELASCYPGSTSVAALQAFGPFAIGGGNPQVLPGSTQVQTFAGAPNPNSSVGCNVELGGVERLLNTSFHEYDWIYKMDLNLGKSDHLFGRYIFQKATYLNTESGDAAAGYPVNVPSIAQIMLVDWSHTFSARALNQFRASWGRENVQFENNTLGTMPSSSNLGAALAQIGFATGANETFGVESGLPQGRIVNTYQLQDNFSLTLGKHQLKAGVNWTRQYSPNIFLPNYNGSYQFQNWGDFAANTPNFVGITKGNPNLNFLEHDTFLYFGDDWKVKENLTVNLGVTWSYYGQPFNEIHNISVANQTSSTPFWNPSLPQSITTLPKLNPTYTLFGPNVGFAYTPHFWNSVLGGDKTVIRGGYRLSYDPPFYNIYILFPYFAPLSFSQTIGATATTAAPLLPSNPSGANVRGELAPDLTTGVFDPRSFFQIQLPKNFSPDRVHSWSLGLQRQLAKDVAVEARYVGNHAEDLFQTVNGNPYVSALQATFPSTIPSGVHACATPEVAPPPGGTVSPSLGREHCNLGLVADLGNYGFSDYEGLQTEIRATNLWRQLTLRSAYTFSKTTDTSSAAFQTTLAGGSSYAEAQDPFNPINGEHGLSGLDFPNTWSMSFEEYLPAFRSQHGIIGHVLGGWAIAGTYSIISGQAYTPVQEFLNAFSGGVADDIPFNTGLVGVYDFVRPFAGSSSAPASDVGVYAGDACPALGVGCTLSPDQLISFNAVNASGAAVPVSKSNVRYIANGATADSIFGTPFGNIGRNSARDAMTNTGNFGLFKNIRFNDRASLQWHMTMVNVFNHPNFGTGTSGVDAVIEDAGLKQEGVGFGLPYLEGGGFRTIYFGLKVIF
jgi:Carboxypeptidase regulatory-like domain